MSKRIQIIEAALVLFVQQGLQGTPMSQVAKAAGTGMGTIYNQFESKEELINEIYMYVKEKEAQYIFKDYSSQQSVRLRFEYIFGQLMDFFIENPIKFQFMDRFATSPVITDQARNKGAEHFGSILNLFEEGQSERIIKDIPIKQLGHFVMGSISSLMRFKLITKEPVSKGDIQRQLVLAWDAIKL